MNVLVLNAGSSSLKFDLWEDAERLLVQDTVERVESMRAAIEEAFGKLGDAPVHAVGHRVVHGGERFREPVIIDAEVERGIDELSALAPLHNPHSLEGIRAAREKLPTVKHVAVFDTAFHGTLPPRAYVYGLPYEYLAEKKVRRYGFHGISHRYVSLRFAEIHGKSPAEFRLITCHLGNGCSVCAVDRGRSVDTSMGFTPLEGLLMGTRSGDVDAGAILHLVATEKRDARDVLRMLNETSGIKGLSGISNDMRDVLAAARAGNERAELAIEAFCYRVKKYIGSYLAAMGGADALIFTGGIGENSVEIRARICEGLGALGIDIDAGANGAGEKKERRIGGLQVGIWVIPTQEEKLIAAETLRLAG
ncbi:MAG TPA: acetate kinase [Bryobacteraceae bacterium]|nr:acetate kinase [Bryobacteraceae bacterium]